MKRSINISLILIALIITNCRKDVGLLPAVVPTPVPTPMPFIEYRDGYVGNYVGVLSVISYTRGDIASQNPYTIRDTVTTPNVTTNITKSTLTNTVIESTNPLGSFGVLSTGEYTYSAPCCQTPDPFVPELKYYTIQFRNDSIYIYTAKTYQPIYRQKDVTYYTTFNGKKQ